MIRRLLRSLGRGASRAAPAPRAPEGMRIYAVGDIHGCADLLDSLHARIAHDLIRAPVEYPLIVYLGDYVDRGPDSCGVLERLCQPPPPGVARTLLKGNHEAMLLRFLADPETGGQWRRFGGMETLLSYRVDVQRALARGGLAALGEAFAQRFPPHHFRLLEELDISLTVGDYFFCHAGVRPGVPLDRQKEVDLLWARDMFLDSDEDFGKVVVHGHTPAEQPERRWNRIGVDTGAYATQRLTCVALEGEQQRFLVGEPPLRSDAAAED